MSNQFIALKVVDDLRVGSDDSPLQFLIPAYQRGYRWSQLQVRQLLDDIREFTKRKNPQPEDFYCLQPLVVKARSCIVYEIVDGQQRLTTLLLIMRHFNQRLNEKYQKKLFELNYETRLNFREFLANPTQVAAKDTVDNYHVFQAIETIEKWFEEHDSAVEEIKTALLTRTKVIWFQLAPSENPVEAFTRLNVGKIPLTNEELIRALFLRRSGPDESDATRVQLQIAYEWDQLEKALQSNAFWYFLSNQKGKSDNRIGFLFDIVANTNEIPPEVKSDPYGIFYTFNQNMKKDGVKVEDEWRKIKQLYLLLEEWFDDRVLYHMVGFLVSKNVTILEIRALSENCTKSSFEHQLRKKIFKLAIDEEMPNPLEKERLRLSISNRLTDLSYPSNKIHINALLLLFNIATLLQNHRSNLRFQFDSFKSERWDIEHIRSVSDDRPDRFDERKNWLTHSLGYLKSINSEQGLQDEIIGFLNLSPAEANTELFDPLYDNVLKYFQEKSGGAVEHGISNLTLLDESTNRSYKNAVYAVKRKHLLELDQAGIFVPLCTRNVFLKCYSPQVDNVMFWGECDREGYLSTMINVLVDFFTGNMEGNK